MVVLGAFIRMGRLFQNLVVYGGRLFEGALNRGNTLYLSTLLPKKVESCFDAKEYYPDSFLHHIYRSSDNSLISIYYIGAKTP